MVMKKKTVVIFGLLGVALMLNLSCGSPEVKTEPVDIKKPAPPVKPAGFVKRSFHSAMQEEMKISFAQAAGLQELFVSASGKVSDHHIEYEFGITSIGHRIGIQKIAGIGSGLFIKTAAEKQYGVFPFNKIDIPDVFIGIPTDTDPVLRG